MTAAELVRTRILALSAVTALVSTRVYHFALPTDFHGTAVRVQRISDVEPAHLRGSGGTRWSRVQVDAVAPTLAEAYAIDQAIHGDGDGSGLAGFAGTVGGQVVQAALPQTSRDVYDPEEIRLYRVMRDYFVWYQETT